MNDLRKLSRGDIVRVIDRDGVAWSGVVAMSNSSFVQLANGQTYWTEDGLRVGGNGRIEQASQDDLAELVDVSFLD